MLLDCSEQSLYPNFNNVAPSKASAHHLPGSNSIHTLLECSRLPVILAPLVNCPTMENSTPGPLRTFRVSNVTSNGTPGSATASGNGSVVPAPSESVPAVVKKGIGST